MVMLTEVKVWDGALELVMEIGALDGRLAPLQVLIRMVMGSH